jgi:hypothetical protein
VHALEVEALVGAVAGVAERDGARRTGAQVGVGAVDLEAGIAGAAPGVAIVAGEDTNAIDVVDSQAIQSAPALGLLGIAGLARHRSVER